MFPSWCVGSRQSVVRILRCLQQQQQQQQHQQQFRFSISTSANASVAHSLSSGFVIERTQSSLTKLSERIFVGSACRVRPYVSLTVANTGTSCIKMTGNQRYQIVERGAPNSTDYRVFFKTEDGHAVSPLHDIPLYANAAKTVLNMVVEVPRWTNAKMEISLGEGLNPIKQDVKKGKLRFVANCFPHHGYIWNYGAFPQTWENPDHLDPNTGCKGDNDPIDVLEIGSRVAKRGDVVQVKILGTVALIDEGETDWKIITIDINDPLASQVNDINDVDKVFPGLLKATIEWFKIYKIPDGKPENQFAFNGEAKDAAFATKVVEETNKFWKALINKEIDGTSISCLNTTVEGSPYLVSADNALEVLAKSSNGGETQPFNDTIHKWHFREENPYSKL